MDHSGLEEVFLVLKEAGCHHVQVIGVEHLEGSLFRVALKLLIQAEASDPSKKHDDRVFVSRTP